MITDDKIRSKKLQYDINWEAANISALSSRKIDKYEYLTGKEILPSTQRQIIEQAQFTYCPLAKAFDKQRKTIKRKTIKDQVIKQVEALKALKREEALKTLKKIGLNQELESIEGIFPKKMRTDKIKNEIDETRKWEKNWTKRLKMQVKYLHDF